MKGTRPLDNNGIRNLGLEGGLNFRWQYKFELGRGVLLSCRYGYCSSRSY